MRPLRRTLLVIAAFQIGFGLLFTAAPALTDDLLDLTPAHPPWVNWLFAMMGARFLAFGYGMVVAARDPARHVAWIDAMIGVQIVDWIATVAALAGGHIALPLVTTALVAPPLFVAGLLWWHPRRRALTPVTSP